MLVVQYYMSDRLILMSTGAKQVSAEQEPALHRMIKTLADRYEMPMPKVAVIDTAIPNAFATGRNPKNALVAVTTGIQQRLSERELQAVIGHELAHVANRDMRVLAIANFLVTLTSFLMTMLFWNMLFGGMGGRRGNGGGGVMMVGPGAGGGADGGSAEEQTEFDVVLESFGEKKIPVIKVVRAATGLGLKEAKAVVDDAPGPVKQGISKVEAEELAKLLEAEGATVEIK